ncbi:MAG: putative porin [Candidatus Omnitrophica bacterium]|nr:putative porin [Candidatus Omnitrophota bacterium]
MKKLMLVLSVIGMVALPVRSYAGEMDVLLGKLVDKGILTASEAQEIRTETNDEIAKQEKVKQEDYKKLAKDSMPDWVKNIKFSGDFRNRYQWDKSKSATSVATERNRDRIRVRLGADMKVIDDFKVGFGIATGTTTDPKSTNVTLGDGFSFKNIILDYGYGQYIPHWTAPVDTTFTAGKFKNPFWEPINALVDGDINPEGAALQLKYNVNPSANVFLNYGFLYLGDTFPKTKNPLQNVIQPGVDWKILDNVKLKSTVDFWLAEVKGMTQINNTPGSNTLARNSDQGPASNIVYQNDYNSVVPKLEVGFSEPFFGYNPGFPYFSVFGEYIDNLSANAKGTGWLAGFKIGNEKVADKYQWQLVYDHRMIERDAFLDAYPDSDFYGGKTGAAGDHVGFNFGLSKNSWVTLSYFNTRNVSKVVSRTDDGSKLGSQTIQADWTIKF